MRSLRRCGIVAAVSLISASFPATTVAQSLPDLVGTWNLNTRASDFGMGQPTSSSTLVFERADDVLVLNRTTTGMGEGRTTRFDMPTDGEVHEANGHAGVTDARAEWDGDTFVLSVVAESNMGPLPITERMSLSEDGNTLTISRSIAVPGMGDMVQTLVFERESAG